MSEQLGRWLKQKCRGEHLSLRQAGTKTGLSHVTISSIIKGRRPVLETISKLAQAFGGDGGLVLEDYLLELEGYRIPRARRESGQAYLLLIPLLSPEHQHILEILVRELSKVEGIEVPAG